MRPVPRVFDRLSAFMLAHRWWALLGFVVVSLAIAAGAAQLRVDFSARAYFGAKGDTEKHLADFHRAFGPDDDAIFVLLKTDDTVLDQAGLDRVHQLSEALQRVDGVDDVISLTHTALPTQQDGALAFVPAARDVPADTIARAGFRARLLQNQQITPTILADDGSATVIAATYGKTIDPDDIGAVRPLVQRIDDIVRDVPGASLAGLSVVRARLLGLILGDQIQLVPLSFALMALLLFFLYRRAIGVILPLLAAGIPSVLVMGVMGYRGEPIGVVNQVYFTLLPVIAVSGAIHLISRYYDDANDLGTHDDTLIPQHRTDAVQSALRHVGAAIFFSALTTVVGLFSLHLSDMPVLKSFGLYSGVGVAFAFFTIIILLPILLAATRGRVLDPDKAARESRINLLLGRCADISLGRPKLFIALSGLVLAGCLWLGQSVVLDNTVSELLKPEHPTTQAGRLVDKKLGGIVALEVHLKGPPGSFVQPDVLRALDAMERAAQEEPAVRAVQSPASLVRALNQGVVGEDAIPDERNVVTQLLFLAEGRPEVSRVLTADKSEARLSIRVRDIGGRAFIALRDRLAKRFDEVLAAVPDKDRPTLVFTGTPLSAYVGINALSSDLRNSVSVAFLVIILIISFIFRSPRVGLVAFLPNLLPLAVGYAALAVFDWKLEPGPAVVFVVALGIAVDDTIHLLVRVFEHQSRGEPLKLAIRNAVIRAGRPVIITTVILTAGFLVNVQSSFPTNARVGALGALVIFVALLCDLFVLPPFLLIFGAKREGNSVPKHSLRS